jgi:uncharacterized MAPEG superfamily protein
VGLPAFLENREAMPTIEGWAGRANRAHRNMLENLVLFAILVLVAQVTGSANATTAFGSELFFAARLIPTESQNHRANRQFLLGATRVCFVINWDSTVRGGWGGS